ncbi:MAG TPA: hypothetical protein VJ767_03640 [Nitrososphaeraceae archaeon]|nr:hypothetical protein [Nitrososphaeraceae archaeon]
MCTNKFRIAVFLSEICLAALPLRIWRLASQPYESAHAQGWVQHSFQL